MDVVINGRLCIHNQRIVEITNKGIGVITGRTRILVDGLRFFNRCIVEVAPM